MVWVVLGYKRFWGFKFKVSKFKFIVLHFKFVFQDELVVVFRSKT